MVGDAIRFVTANNNSNGTHRGIQNDKPKVDAYVIEDKNKDKKGCDIQRPEEETKCRPADATTNSVF